MNFKIYGLRNPKTNNIFYVGVTSSSLSKRLTQHVYDARHYRGKNKDKDEIIRTLDADGIRPEIICIEEGIDNIPEADLAEELAIMEYREINPALTNKKTGGYDYHPYSERCDIHANGWLQ